MEQMTATVRQNADTAQEANKLATSASQIVGSVGKVESSSKVVSSAGQTMADVVSQVQRVSDPIAKITGASAEQGTGIAQVSRAVNQLDQMRSRTPPWSSNAAQPPAACKSRRGARRTRCRCFR